MKKITLIELAKVLGYKRVDEAKNWCERCGIKIFGKLKSRFVLEMDVMVELDTEVITYFIEKYGNDWAGVYELYKENNFEGLINVKFASMLLKGSKLNEKKVVAKSESAQKFLKNIA